MEAFGIIVILLAISVLFCLSYYKKSKDGKTRSDGPNPAPRSYSSKEESLSSPVQMARSEDSTSVAFAGPAPPEFPSLKGTMRIVIKKNRDPWIDFHGSKGLVYPFNVRTRKWKDNFSPFTSTPRKLLAFVTDCWIEINGEIAKNPSHGADKDVVVVFEDHRMEMDPTKLSSFEGNLSIASFSDSISYAVNLSSLTCTCPDFQKRRQDLPTNNPSRLCKHLVKAIVSKWGRTETAFLDPVSPMEVRWCGKYKKGMPLMMLLLQGVMKIENNTIQFYVKYVKGDWINVYYPGPSGALDRFNFVPDEQRWSGNNPFPTGTRRMMNGKLLKLCREYDTRTS